MKNEQSNILYNRGYNRRADKRQRADSYTHRHKACTSSASVGSTRAFHEAEAASRVCGNNEERRIALATVRQDFVLGKTRSPLSPFSSPFIAQGGKDVTSRYIIFILCPFGQRYASISYLMNVCYLGYSHQSTCPNYEQYNKTCANVQGPVHAHRLQIPPRDSFLHDNMLINVAILHIHQSDRRVIVTFG